MGTHDKPNKYFDCSDCGRTWVDYEIKERQGKLFGPCCLMRTAERRAQEKWHEAHET